MTAKTLPVFTPAGSFDFTKLSNFVPPERTLERPEFTWLDAPSSFYLAYENILSQEACKRRKPAEMEFARVRDESMTDETHDAIRSALFMADVFDKPYIDEALSVVETHGASHFFWLSTVISGRRGAVAYVKDNTFYVL